MKNKMKRMIKLGGSWYSQYDLEFLLSLLKQQETTDKIESGYYVFDNCGSRFTIYVSSYANIHLLSIG